MAKRGRGRPPKKKSQAQASAGEPQVSAPAKPKRGRPPGSKKDSNADEVADAPQPNPEVPQNATRYCRRKRCPIAPRQCRTRSYAKSWDMDRIALHPERRGYVLLWQGDYEYYQISFRKYCQAYAREGRPPAPDIYQAFGEGPTRTQDDRLHPSDNPWPGGVHKTFCGTWPWRYTVPLGIRMPRWDWLGEYREGFGPKASDTSSSFRSDTSSAYRYRTAGCTYYNPMDLSDDDDDGLL